MLGLAWTNTLFINLESNTKILNRKYILITIQYHHLIVDLQSNDESPELKKLLGLCESNQRER